MPVIVTSPPSHPMSKITDSGWGRAAQPVSENALLTLSAASDVLMVTSTVE